MTEKKRWPCKLTPNGLERCWALDEVLEIGGQGTKYQGLKLNTMINMDTHKFGRHLVVLKSGKHGKKGLVLNLCPFCAGELVEGALVALAKRAVTKRTKTAAPVSPEPNP